MRLNEIERSAQTIAAIATAQGTGAIAIIRISGPDTERVLSQLTHRRSFESHRFCYGHVYEGNEAVDEVMFVYMAPPHTYTREPSAEIDCHGGSASASAVLRLCMKYGAVPAEPGEFTRRAYLNGRIDLAEAEAVAMLIQAGSERAARAALRQLSGGLSARLTPLYDRMLGLMAAVEANIDYAEDGVEELSDAELISGCNEVLNGVRALLATAQTGRYLSSGFRVTLAGAPNAGKSSIMNLLLGRSRSIVTDIPGTTRDAVEDTLIIDGIPIKLADTAGIREASNEVERIGVGISKQYIEDADLVLCIMDTERCCTPTGVLTELGRRELSELETLTQEKQRLFVLNKTDLTGEEQLAALVAALPEGASYMAASALDGSCLPELEERIAAYFPAGNGEDEVLVSNARHTEALRAAEASLLAAVDGINSGFTCELAAIDMRAALSSIGSILGLDADEEVTDRIFADFCVGK